MIPPPPGAIAPAAEEFFTQIQSDLDTPVLPIDN
jgi:hypothetical protein